jgi:hypothetical protein
MVIESGSEPSGLATGLAQVALLAVVGGFLIWLADGEGLNKMRTYLASSTQHAAAASNGLVPNSCRPGEIRLSGVFTGCAFDSGPETGFGVHPPPLCVTPAPGPNYSIFMHLRDATRDYLLYVQVVGRYHGPGTYQLGTRPRKTVHSLDQDASVAVREFTTGALWLSTAGVIRVDQGGGSGTVKANLQPSAPTSGGRGLRIEGPWRCD